METPEAPIQEIAKPPFKTPYHEVTLKEFGEKVPDKKAALDTVLSEIDRQGIGNFSVYNSESHPGVAFSYTKLSVTPDLVRELASQNSSENTPPITEEPTQEVEQADTPTEGKEENTNAKRQDYFLFVAYDRPPGGHPFTGQDVAIDRFIRLLPRVAAPMKRGEQSPEVNVYLLGAPTGFGGKVTPEWINGIKEHGLDEYGKLYAEFIRQQLPTDSDGLNNTHVVLQGVSKGAVVAEKTSSNLPEELQAVTQRLLDNPAGDHGAQKAAKRWLKGGEVALGFMGEGGARMLFDDTMKDLVKAGGNLVDNLSKETGIEKDNNEQSRLKKDAAVAEGIALIKGTSLDTENTRSFIRQGIYDPLSFSPRRLLDIWRKKRNPNINTPFSQVGKSLETPFKGKHFFIYNRYNRWAQILDYAASAFQQPAQ